MKIFNLLKADFLFRKGQSFVTKDDFISAINSFSNSLELSPSASAVYLHRGLAYNSNEDYENATKDIEKAIELNSKKACYYLLNAIVFFDSGRYQEAINSSEKAMQIDSSYNAPKTLKALSLASLGDLHNGILLLKDNFPYLISRIRARALYLCEDIIFNSKVETNSLFESLLIDEQEEKNKDTLFNKLFGSTKKEDIKDTIFDRIVNNNDLGLDAFQEASDALKNEIIESFILKKDFKTAYKLLEEMDASVKDSHDYKLLSSYLLIHLEKLDEAITLLKELLRKDRCSFMVDYYLGTCYQRQNNKKLSILSFEKALNKLNPDVLKKRIRAVEKIIGS